MPPVRRLGLDPLRVRQLAFGWTAEDVRVLVTPLATKGKEADGSMGSDVPLAVLSDQSPSLFSYFKQRFAQVTNPAIDPIRESIVMSLQAAVGPGAQPAGGDRRTTPTSWSCPSPSSRTTSCTSCATSTTTCSTPRPSTAPGRWPKGRAGWSGPSTGSAPRRAAAVGLGVTVIILSDRAAGHDRVPVPSLLAVSAVHHHLVRRGTRLRTGIVVESGEPREVHHMACLLGYGASRRSTPTCCSSRSRP